MRYQDDTVPWFLSSFLLLVFALAGWQLTATWHDVVTVSAGQLEESIRTGSGFRQLALCCLGGYALVSMLRSGRWPLQPKGVAGVVLIAYVLLACASIGWTVDHELTMRGSTRLIMMSAGAIAVAHKVTSRQIVKCALLISAATLGASILAELLHYSEIGSEEWRFGGVMHPVSQAWNCSILSLSAWHLAAFSPKRRALYRLTIGIGILFLALTKSRVAFGATLVSILVSRIASLDGRRKTQALILAVLTVGACITAMAISEGVQRFTLALASFGRGVEGVASVSTLTGRLPLWNQCLEFAFQKPYLGFGYNTFLSPTILLNLSDSSGWMSSPHSGYIGAFLEVGGIGLALLCIGLALSIYRSASLAEAEPDHCFAVALLVWLAINMITESFLINSASFPTFLAMTVLARLTLTDPDNHLRFFRQSERTQ